MSKGIKRIIISEEDISSGQLIKFPQLLNGCEVYGLRANGKSVSLSVEIDEKVLSDVEDKVKTQQIHSGIKWVYGKVYNLQKGGISWHGWYRDSNRNNKKDDNEEWILNTSIEQISKIDLHNVQGNYTIQKTIQIKFDNKPYDTPTLSWVEPFLIHPELHFSKNPKGIFIVPIAEPKIYRTDLLINNSPFDRKLQIPLPKTEKESQENDHVVYYGENLLFALHTCTLSIPEDAEFTVIIDQKEQFGSDSGFLGIKIERYKTIYEKKVNGLKPENDDFWSEDLDYELVSYLSQYFKKAELLIPLAIDNKPENQKEKTKRTFLVTIKLSATSTDTRNLYPIQYGYLTIGYTDMYSLLEIQNEEVDKFVEKANEVLLQPQGDPCHYTRIQAHKEDKEITLFEEKKEGIKLNPVEISLIAGDEKPYLLTLSTNLKTEECKTQQHTQGADSVFYFPANLSSEKQGIKIQKIDYNSVDLLIPYKYIRDHSTLGVINDFPFNYFWLNEKDVQKHVIMAETCRYSIPVKINVYPDIEWQVNFFFNTTDPIYFGGVDPEYCLYNLDDSYSVDKNISFRDIKNKGDVIALADLKKNERQIKRQNQSTQTRIKTKFNRDLGDMLSYFGLSIKVGYNGNVSHEISWKMFEKYRKTLKIFKDIYDKVEKVTGAADAQKASKEVAAKTPSLLGRLNAMSLSLEAPAPSLGFAWKYAAVNNLVGRQFEGYVKCAPLIGGNLKIDLLALADKIPVYGKLITALDLATWLANKITFGALEINYRLDLTFSANLAIAKAFVNWNDARPEGKKFDSDMNVSGTFGGKLELSLSVKMNANKFKKYPEIDFEVGVKADCYFKITANPNFNWDNKIDWKTEFSGLIIEVYFKVGIKKGNQDVPKKSTNPLKLLPSYKGKQTMVFGKE
ncbi:MAG: hypothetical protein J6581_03370 [Apibacter sp.]|nr:hypothetical protein [Apibacter sp.]